MLNKPEESRSESQSP